MWSVPLVAVEPVRELFRALIVEWQQLDVAWPKGRTAMERYELGCRHRECLERIRELREPIVETEARTLAGAAVQLRRLNAMIDGDERQAIGQLVSALQVVEEEALPVRS